MINPFRDKNGNIISYEDAENRRLSFEYNESGELSNVKMSFENGAVLYDKDGNILSVIYTEPVNGIKEIQYENNFIKKTIDANGVDNIYSYEKDEA